MTYNTGPKIVTDGLVLCVDAADRNSYPGTGTSWLDLSGSSYNGTFMNSPAFSSNNGGVLSFDGTDDSINFGNILDGYFAASNKKFTLSIWVKFDTLTTSTYAILAKNGDSNLSENNRQLILYIRDSRRLAFIHYGHVFGTSYRLHQTDQEVIQAGEWYNLVATYDETIDTNNGLDRVVLYKNSSVLSKTLGLTSGTLQAIPTSSARFSANGWIGATGTSPVAPFNGLIANISVYSRVLSADEVLQNYNATKGRFGL